jgi:hypothetical protein
MDATLLALISYYSTIYGIDSKIVESIVMVESSGKQYAVGSAGERGLMQIRPEFVKEEGIDLFEAEDNISIGVKMLSEMKKRCPHREGYTWTICWNTGVSGAYKIEDPYSNKYYNKVMAVYNN